MLSFRKNRACRWAALLVGLVALATLGCMQPRMKKLSKQKFQPLFPDETVDVYVGRIEEPHKNIAIIETSTAGWVNEEIKRRWIEELQKKARDMGANAIQDTRILTKRVAGFVPDEQTPFASVRQGSTEFYFMRATAIRMSESEPASFSEARPASGWVVEQLPEPPRLPGLREETPAAQPAQPENEARPTGAILDEPNSSKSVDKESGNPAPSGLPGKPSKKP